MVETKPPTSPPGAPQPEPGPGQPLQIPAVAGGFDFGAFLVSAFVITLLATGALFGYRYLLLERTLDEQKQQITQLESELAEPQMATLDNQVQAIAGGIDKIRPVLEDPIRYAELFWTLRKVTEKGVRWTSLGFNEVQQLSLTGEALGWGQISRQLAGMKADTHFTKVDLTAANVEIAEGASRVHFSVTAQVDQTKLVSPTATP